MTLPKKYALAEAPASVRLLLSSLLPQLIEGEHPALAVLREQYRVATISDVELTGVGFFVNFEVPPGAALTDPANFTGGSAEIVLTGTEHGAGCLVFVRDGRLLMFEGYTYEEPWREDAQVVEIKSVTPIDPAAG